MESPLPPALAPALRTVCLYQSLYFFTSLWNIFMLKLLTPNIFVKCFLSWFESYFSILFLDGILSILQLLYGLYQHFLLGFLPLFWGPVRVNKSFLTPAWCFSSFRCLLNCFRCCVRLSVATPSLSSVAPCCTLCLWRHAFGSACFGYSARFPSVCLCLYVRAHSGIHTHVYRHAHTSTLAHMQTHMI